MARSGPERIGRGVPPQARPSSPPAARSTSYSVFFPPSHFQAMTAEAGRAKSNAHQGRVKVTVYAGRHALRGPQVYEGVVNGFSTSA